MSGGNYFIAVEQILSSLQLQRLKLFDRLSITPSHSHQQSLCCTKEFDEEELLVLDDAIVATDEHSKTEAAALYYSCGYIAFKEGLHYGEVDSSVVSDSEFLTRVSRGGLSFPSPALFAFGRACYYVFVMLNKEKKRSCSVRFRKLFICLGNSFPFDFGGDLCNISRRLANIFFKGIIRSENESGRHHVDLSTSQRKLRKLNSNF